MRGVVGASDSASRTADPDLLRRMGEALGDESRAMGVQVLLGPGINLKRTPLGGRRRAGFRPPLAATAGVPVVYAFLASDSAADCSVVPDEAGGTRSVVEHLLRVGRRRVAVVTGPAHHHSARVRAAAAVSSLGDALAAPPLPGEWSEAWGHQAVAGLLAQAVPFDAMVCGNDLIARGATDALREAGRPVPDDVAAAGFDNWDVFALASRPPLTSVDMDLEGLGRAAAGLLLKAIAGEPSPGVHPHAAKLVIRASTVPG